MKLSAEAATEAHARYLADPTITLATLAPGLGMTPSGLRKRWLLLGLSCAPANGRGGNLAARERSAQLQADFAEMSAPFFAKRKAAGCTRHGFRADLARKAWSKYLLTGCPIHELAAEIGCAYTTLQRAFARFELGAKAARKAMDSKRIEPVTLRLNALVADGMDIDKAAPLVGLTPAAAYKRLERLAAKKIEWRKPEPTGATP